MGITFDANKEGQYIKITHQFVKEILSGMRTMSVQYYSGGEYSTVPCAIKITGLDLRACMLSWDWEEERDRASAWNKGECVGICELYDKPNNILERGKYYITRFCEHAKAVSGGEYSHMNHDGYRSERVGRPNEHLFVGCPYESEAEIRAFEKMLRRYKTNYGTVFAINETAAAAAFALNEKGLKAEDTRVMVVDLGEEKIKVSLIINGFLENTYESPLGGRMIDERLFDKVRKKELDMKLLNKNIRVLGTINSDPITPDRVYQSVTEAYCGELMRIKEDIEHDMGKDFKADLTVPMGIVSEIEEISKIRAEVFGEEAETGLDASEVVAKGLYLSGERILEALDKCNYSHPEVFVNPTDIVTDKYTMERMKGLDPISIVNKIISDYVLDFVGEVDEWSI